MLRILSQKKGEIKNSKNMGGDRNVSRYRIKHKIKVNLKKVPLTPAC